MAWTPQLKSVEILDRAWKHIQSVPYEVTTRWLFYRLLQDGLYSNKEDYSNKFKCLLSDARKRFYKDWRPDTLVDDTRRGVVQKGNYQNAEDWFSAMAGNSCWLDEWGNQPNYVEIWFEAEAMLHQFEYYADYVTLWPFRGDPSIDQKYKMAKAIDSASAKYQRPVTILYFGDLDKKGIKIPDSALKDIRDWTRSPFNFIRCGLTPEQVEKYGVPENPDKPGEYQWEAIPDEGAREIITGALEPYVDEVAFDETARLEGEATEKFQKKMVEVIKELQDNG